MQKDDNKDEKEARIWAADDGDTNSNRHAAVMQLRRRQYKRLFYWPAGWPADERWIACRRARR